MSDDKTVVPGFIRGYRIWSMRGNTPIAVGNSYLYGVAHQAAWRPNGPMEARCPYNHPYHETPSPDAGCRCGLYAKYLPQNLYGSFSKNNLSPRIPGIIDAWGNTILATAGFRAQKAVIRALWVEPSIEPFIRAAGEFYQVPVFDTREEAVEAYPPTDVSELVDTRDEAERFISNHAAGMAIDLGKVSVSMQTVTVAAQDFVEAARRLVEGFEGTVTFHNVDPEIIKLINGEETQ